MKKIFDLSRTYYYIIDTSYIVFCSAAAAFKEYVIQEDIMKKDLNPDFDPTIDPEFNYILDKKFRQRIENPIRGNVPLSFDRSKYIFTIDCPRKDIWRRQFFPEYKLPRDVADHSKDEFNLGKVFNYVYSNIIPNYCDEFNSMIVQSTCAESDDIIAVLSKYILNADKNNEVIILSSDRDMVQLFNDRTMIVTTQNEIRNPKKEFMKLTKLDDLDEDINANDFLLFKIIIGDGSDNIPGIKHRMGPKHAMKYVLDKSRTELKKLMKEDINIFKSFKRNKQLISMDEIPNDVKNLIVENIEDAFKKAKLNEENHKNQNDNDQNDLDIDEFINNMI